MTKKTEKTEPAVSKVEQRRAELQAQLDVLDVLCEVEKELEELIERYEAKANDYLTRSVEDGYESTQAKNYEGELLYRVDGDDYHSYTEAALQEKKGLTPADPTVKPYYKVKYKEVPIKPEDLDSWDKPRYLKNCKMVELLKAIEVV